MRSNGVTGKYMERSRPWSNVEGLRRYALGDERLIPFRSAKIQAELRVGAACPALWL